MNINSILNHYFLKEIETLEKINQSDIVNAIHVLEESRKNHKKIYVCGNGGSAATAAHFVCDFNKNANENKKTMYDVECLSDNVSLMMAVANDISYDDIFVFPLKHKLQPDDVLIAISGSGNSENVIRAVKYANEIGAETIGLVGYDGGEIKKLIKNVVHVNINDMQVVEDIHMIIMHAITQALSTITE